MNVISIQPFTKEKFFNEEEAQSILPLLKTITLRTKNELARLNSQLEFNKSNKIKYLEIQDEISYALQQWSDKIRRLGCYPVSMGRVRIPSFENNFLWEVDSDKILCY